MSGTDRRENESVNVRAIEARVLPLAKWLLAASVLIHFVLVITQAKMTMIDLLVYRDGPPSILHGTLYDWRLAQYSQQFALPFTYPPFAAIVFLPLSWVPWGVVRIVWQVISVICLWWLVRLSLRLIGKDRISVADAIRLDPVTEDAWRQRAMLWTALLIWTEPVRTTLNYGQINLLLAAVVLAGMVSTRPLLSGLSVGLTTGVKLTPALSGIYFLATKRWAAAAWSAVAFAVTVGVAYAVSPAQSTLYWFHLLSDTSRIGPVGSAINQSLRGALSRTVGYDVGSGPVWLAGAAVAAVLLFFALRASVRARDTLAGIVSVQFFTLLVSPISWSHHWVWMVPALLWLLYGRAAGGRLVMTTAVIWLVAVGSFLISFLLKMQGSIWSIPRPWYESLLGWVYPACGLLTLVTIAVALHARRPEKPIDSAGVDSVTAAA
ncbi:MAG TPA: mannosyltransferase [Pseudonocardiaceae bacterium]|jgi:alpha-1,2-mannosyltransferase|nr:mannosyltransferase [Pseudonocardiaceae bacterium]